VHAQLGANKAVRPSCWHRGVSHRPAPWTRYPDPRECDVAEEGVTKAQPNDPCRSDYARSISNPIAMIFESVPFDRELHGLARPRGCWFKCAIVVDVPGWRLEFSVFGYPVNDVQDLLLASWVGCPRICSQRGNIRLILEGADTRVSFIHTGVDGHS
jgi:hypothetical protein